MLEVLNHEYSLPEIYYVHAYNNLGLVKKSIGLYSEALFYYNEAEKLLSVQNIHSVDMADIFQNKSRIYTFQKSFFTAIEFLDQVISIYNSIDNPDKNLLLKISRAYMNLGLVYYEINDCQKAMEYLGRSLYLKLDFSLSEIELTYLNLAKTHAKLGNLIRAEDFFLKSIKSMMSNYGEDYYRIAEIYFDYGIFLSTIGNTLKSKEINNKALSICLNNYGEKHPYVSLAFRNIGDYYRSVNDYDSSLFYYQKSLTSIVIDFNESDINRNPALDSVILDVDLLKTLRRKSEALNLYSEVQNDSSKKLQALDLSLQTIELALHLIDRIRNDYMSEESRIYLAENEKETYLSAIRSAKALYDLTGETTYVRRMYEIASRAKVSILRNAITENDLLWSAGIPDSLNSRRTSLSVNISAYNNLLLEESQKRAPDSSKIALWKDALFEMNREKERVSMIINEQYPQVRKILLKTEPVSPDEIQKQLHRNETVVDYLLSNKYNNGKRDLYTFLITRDTIRFIMSSLDSVFTEKAGIIRDHTPGDAFSGYTGALSYMHRVLVKPADEIFTGKRLIIIPDEEISWLPFDAFLSGQPETENTGYEGLPYLANRYSVSYAYSSSLIWGRSGRLKRGGKLYAFSPDYGDESTGMLTGAEREIESVIRMFRGTGFTGTLATETSFRQAASEPALFHLAMHLVTDSLNSEYSWLAFYREKEGVEDGKLHNYEISLMKMNSPMVVLSACNSGSGTLYHGEGVMSMARGFLLAGASSVVRTSWEVNDETSAGIMTGFYRNLSRGMNKSDALRQAKLSHLEQSIPSLSDPWYWAAYEIIGDNSPVMRNITLLVMVLAALALIAFATAFYLRRRRILSERSE
ncbi:MAG: CHAT domain-containing protein [Bacteroidota bacterium]